MLYFGEMHLGKLSLHLGKLSLFAFMTISFLSMLEWAIYEFWEFKETLFLDIELTLGNVQANV